MEMLITVVEGERDPVIEQPTEDDVRTAIEELNEGYSIRVVLKSDRKYLRIIYTQNNDRVWVRFSDDDKKIGGVRDSRYDPDEYSYYYFEVDAGIQSEEIDCERTIPKDIAIPIAVNFVQHGYIIDVPKPYYWSGNLDIHRD